MMRWIIRYRWPMALTLVLVALLSIAGTIAAQPPVPHAVMPGEDCLSCHQSGATGAPKVSWDHLGRSNEDCVHCHQVSGAPSGEIPHPVAGREDCLSCHYDGVGNTPGLTSSHVDYTNDECQQCHLPSAAAAEPTPIPAPVTEEGHASTSAESCISCHQLIFADAEHALFTGQPVGDAQAGATLFVQLCAGCHGEDGATPVGNENAVVNAEAYWSTHDNATVLQDIGAGSHGEMTAFAETYDGPLSWEEILDLAAFVRSWGSLAALASSEAPTYANTVGPLLTGRCGACHGGSAGLTVTDYASLLAGSSAGPVVAPGDPDGSRIVEVQRGEHYVLLNAPELERLIEWIASGAPE